MRRFFIVIAILVLSNLVTFGLLIKTSSDNNIANFKNPYQYLDLSRNFIDQKDFIVNLQPLRESLADIYQEYGADKISLYIEFLNTGANISYNPDARYYPASLIKMPVAIATAKKVEAGEWKWDDQLVVFEEDVNSRSGNLSNSPIGTRFTIEKLLSELLINSDNTAYKMLLRNIGAGPVNDYLVDTGLNDFFDKDLNITAKEYTRLFRSLYTSSYLSREYSQKVLEWLGQSDRNDLSLGIPKDIIFSHKYGENSEEYIYADSGIVYIPNRAYIITVLYKGDGSESPDYLNGFFEKLSKMTYEFFKNA